MKSEHASIILSIVSMVCSILAITTWSARPIPEQIEIDQVQEHSNGGYWQVYLEITRLRVLMSSVEVSYEIVDTHLEEEPSEDMNCLFYATVPIGRYYITAYNHEETGSRKTASGATCHEGTITTCAADPRYHRFGEYLEIDGRIYRVEDTGSAVKNKHIDLYFAEYRQMARYGSNYQTIYKVEFPFGKPADT